MIPDIDTQLLSVIKSLKDNVAPAVDGENSLAQQQLHLALATLNIVRDHLPHVRAYIRTDLNELRSLAQKLLVCSVENDTQLLDKALASSECALEDPALGDEELLIQAKCLRECIGLLISLQGDNKEFDSIVLNSTERPILLGRAWSKPMGYEPVPDAVPELNTLLS